MLIIYDLDKTSLYCPIANFMDRFIPKSIVFKKLYYKLYPFVHILEMKLGLLKINKEMFIRAHQYDEFTDIYQIVVTARHNSYSLNKHVREVFGNIDITTFAIAQGITNMHKVDLVRELPVDNDEEIIMYDDNIEELELMKKEYNGRFTGVNVFFDGEEKILEYVH